MPKTTRVGATLVLAAFLLAGCSGPETESVGALTMAPGTVAHMFVNFSAAGASALEVVDDAGLVIHVPEVLHTNGSGEAFAWVGIEVPTDADPGEREVVLDVEGEEALRVALGVDVQTPSEPLGQGTVALVDLTVHTENGTVAITTRDDVDASPLPRTADYRPPQGGPQAIAVSPEQLPSEIVDPLAAAGVGHSFTVELEEFFGPEKMEQDVPREERIPTTDSLDRYVEMPRAQAEQSGLITSDSQEGDALQVGGPVPYVIETLNATTFRAGVDLDEGDTLTMHESWPNATIVEEVGAGSVVLRTDPPQQAGQRFTWNPSWPDGTEIVEVGDEEILLRHTPEVGRTYTEQTQEGPVEVTVEAVEDENITLSQKNPHPLAGQMMLIEMTVTGEQEAPPQMPVG